ncbi:uncharacterized protein LOC115222888 [Argonauta hians]
MLFKGTMGCGRSKPLSASSLEEVDKHCNNRKSHTKSHASCKKGDKSSHRVGGSKKDVKGVLKQQQTQQQQQQQQQQHQLGRHHQVSSSTTHTPVHHSLQQQQQQRGHHRPLEQASRTTSADQGAKNSVQLHPHQQQQQCKVAASKGGHGPQCHNDSNGGTNTNATTTTTQYDVHCSGVVGSESADKKAASAGSAGGATVDDRGGVAGKKDQAKGEQTSKTAFKDKPSGKFYNTKITRSQLEFFRMLDEKIAQGKDYCSEEET